MAWHRILGHDTIIDRFRRAMERNRLAGSYLFTGEAGIGKRTVAIELAKNLLCERPSDAGACDTCDACTQVAAGTNPDLLQVAKPADRSNIPLELLIGDLDHRMREGLCHDIALKPYRGGRKIAIIDDADYLNVEGANSLLKTLEEPPPASVVILIGTSPAKQLPTIRSRCQMIRFQPLSDDHVARLLLSSGMVSDPGLARRLAEQAGGSLARATSLDDEALGQFRPILIAALSRPRIDSVRLAKAIATFVDEAGKEPRARRARLHHVVAMAVSHYRDALRVWATAPHEAPAAGAVDPETAAHRIEQCLDAAAQIDRNVNLSTLIEYWIDTLAEPAPY